MSFHDNLKQLRKRANLKRKDIAEILGMHPNAYGMYETGTREPNIEKLCKIAAALHVTTDELLGYELDGRGVLLAWLEDMGFHVETVDGAIRVFSKDGKDIKDGWPYESWEELQKAVSQAKENAWHANKENIKNTLKNQFYKDLSEHIKNHGF